MDGQTLAAAIAISRGSGGGSFAPDISNPQDGDTLVYDGTEEKWVNGSGGGSGGGILKVNENPETGALDKTWNEIRAAMNNGYFVSIVQVNDQGMCAQMRISLCEHIGNAYNVTAYDTDGTTIYTKLYVADSADGYPVHQQ